MRKVAKVIVDIFLDREFDYCFDSSENIFCGTRVLIDFNRRKLVGIVISIHSNSNIKNLKSIIKVLDGEPSLSQEHIKFANILSEFYPYPVAEFLFIMLPVYLRGKSKCDFSVKRNVAKDSDFLKGKSSMLSESKLFIKASTFKQRYLAWKEDVSEALKKGSVLICFPQLSYLSKAKSLIEKDFPNQVKVISSQQKGRLSALNWSQTRERSLILGTRMSIFCYPNDLKLIVIEEENSPYYFQEEKPYYHLLDVAFLLSYFKKVRLILSADFPSLNTYKKIKDGEVTLREQRNAENKINVIETGKFKRKMIISPVLAELIRKMFKEDKRGAVLWNKKGFGRVISCTSCDYVFKCERCSSFLQLSLKNNNGICPYCQKTVSLPRICSHCKNGYIKSFGYGIERLRLILKKIFPKSKIDDFQSKNASSQIILATSKILNNLYDEKEFDYGFILDADSFLARTDYDATFKAYIYFKQLSFLFKEKLHIFTGNRDYYLFKSLNQSWSQFYDLELSSRKELDLPPFGLVAKLILRGKDEFKLLKKAQDLYNRLEKKSQVVYGPFEDQPFKLRDKYRYFLIVKAKRDRLSRAALKESIKGFRVSPYHMAVIVQ